MPHYLGTNPSQAQDSRAERKARGSPMVAMAGVAVSTPTPGKLVGEVLGSEDFETLWRVIDAEKLSTSHVMFTLRAVSLLGALPMLADELRDINGDPVNPAPIYNALDRVVNAFHALP